MKLDLTKLPVLEAVTGFLMIMIVIAFVGAFSATGGGASEEGGTETASATPHATPDGETPAPGGAIQIVMDDNTFDPSEITVAAGTSGTFEITNEGASFHNMHIAGPDGYTEDFCAGGGDPCSDPARVGRGGTATLSWEVPNSPGEVDFRCDFHPQEMTGTITIE